MSMDASGWFGDHYLDQEQFSKESSGVWDRTTGLVICGQPVELSSCFLYRFDWKKTAHKSQWSVVGHGGAATRCSQSCWYVQLLWIIGTWAYCIYAELHWPTGCWITEWLLYLLKRFERSLTDLSFQHEVVKHITRSSRHSFPRTEPASLWAGCFSLILGSVFRPFVCIQLGPFFIV